MPCLLISAVPYKMYTVLTKRRLVRHAGQGGSVVPLIEGAITNDERFRAHHCAVGLKWG
jgi:hypothetical protein